MIVHVVLFLSFLCAGMKFLSPKFGFFLKEVNERVLKDLSDLQIGAHSFLFQEPNDKNFPVIIEFEKEKFLLVPQAAILLLVRDNLLDSLSGDEE